MDKINDVIKERLKKSGLLEQEQLFCLYYLESNNATMAYMKAYPNKELDKTRANLYANALLARDKVKYELTELKKYIQKEINIDVTAYLTFLVKASKADMSDYVEFGYEEVPIIETVGGFKSEVAKNEKGEILTRKVNYVRLKNSTDVDTTLIQEIRQSRDGVSLKLVDKKWAMTELNKYFAWSEKENENKDKAEENSVIAALNLTAKDEELWEDDDGRE